MVTMHIAVVCVGLRGLIVVVRRIGALSRGGGFSVAVLAAHARHPVGKKLARGSVVVSIAINHPEDNGPQ